MKVKSALAKVFSVSVGTLSLMFNVSSVRAQTSQLGLYDPTGGAFSDLGGVINSLFSAAFMLLVLVSIVMLIYAGFIYITASGDDSKIEKATKSWFGYLK